MVSLLPQMLSLVGASAQLILDPFNLLSRLVIFSRYKNSLFQLPCAWYVFMRFDSALLSSQLASPRVVLRVAIHRPMTADDFVVSTELPELNRSKSGLSKAQISCPLFSLHSIALFWIRAVTYNKLYALRHSSWGERVDSSLSLRLKYHILTHGLSFERLQAHCDTSVNSYQVIYHNLFRFSKSLFLGDISFFARSPVGLIAELGEILHECLPNVTSSPSICTLADNFSLRFFLFSPSPYCTSILLQIPTRPLISKSLPDFFRSVSV